MQDWRILAERLRDVDVGMLLIGLIVAGVGFYYFLTNTLGLALPQLDWDRVWPLFVIAIGLGIVSANLFRRKGSGS
jgi:ABC-type antimicrobial peptide transport system permease subunit